MMNRSETEQSHVISPADTPLTVVEKAVFLQDTMLFAETATEDLAKIAAITEEVKLQKEEVIFEEKDKGDALFFVIKGEVSLKKEDAEVRRIYAQGTFGDLAFLDNKPREFTAEPLTDVHMLKINSEAFYELLEDHIEITRTVFGSLTAQIRELVER